MVVLGISALSVGPMVLLGQGPALLARLFPFQRGLCHAYWAPNAWALAAALDKLLATLLGQTWRGRLAAGAAASPALRKLFVRAPSAGFGFHSLGGCPLAILPEPSPLLCALLSLLALLPSLWLLWRRPLLGFSAFLLALALANLSAFTFGYHVHEKAALGFLAPLLLLRVLEGTSGLSAPVLGPALGAAVDNLSIVVTYSMTPLLFGEQEKPLAYLLVALQAAAAPLLSAAAAGLVEPLPSRAPAVVLDRTMILPVSRLLAWGLLPLTVLREVLPLLLPRLEFLPLMVLSVYGATANGLLLLSLLTRTVFLADTFVTPGKEPGKTS